jgi:hypothetical protein
MFDKVKEHLNEVITIANKCPEKYQEKCFEILLNSLVRPEAPPVKAGVGTLPATKTDFFSRYSIAEEVWAGVFHFDGTSFSIIAQDLKGRGKAPKQVQLALLLGVKGLLETDKAFISKELLITTCKQYSVFDSSNFASYMKKQKRFFLPEGDGWVLTVPGKEKAAEVIKELAQ